MKRYFLKKSPDKDFYPYLHPPCFSTHVPANLRDYLKKQPDRPFKRAKRFCKEANRDCEICPSSSQTSQINRELREVQANLPTGSDWNGLVHRRRRSRPPNDSFSLRHRQIEAMLHEASSMQTLINQLLSPTNIYKNTFKLKRMANPPCLHHLLDSSKSSLKIPAKGHISGVKTVSDRISLKGFCIPLAATHTHNFDFFFFCNLCLVPAMLHITFAMFCVLGIYTDIRVLFRLLHLNYLICNSSLQSCRKQIVLEGF